VAGRRDGSSLWDLATVERCHFVTPHSRAPPKAPESRKLLKECVSPCDAELDVGCLAPSERQLLATAPNCRPIRLKLTGQVSLSKRTTGSAGDTRVTPARDSFARVSPPSLISWNPTVAGIRSAAEAFNRSVQAYAWRSPSSPPRRPSDRTGDRGPSHVHQGLGADLRSGDESATLAGHRPAGVPRHKSKTDCRRLRD
jgi:hypothetical protein